MSISLPDRKARIVDDDAEYGSYIIYTAKDVSNSILVNPHIWKILDSLAGKYLKPSSLFVSCIQRMRLTFKNRPACLDTTKIIIEDLAIGKVVFNKNSCEFILNGTEGDISITVY